MERRDNDTYQKKIPLSLQLEIIGFCKVNVILVDVVCPLRQPLVQWFMEQSGAAGIRTLVQRR